MNNKNIYFGKPSQSSYYSFECDSLEKAKAMFLSIIQMRLR